MADYLIESKDTLSDHLLLEFQIFKLTAGLVCNKGRQNYETNGFEWKKIAAWVQNRSEDERKKINTCLRNEITTSMQLVICCKEASTRLFNILISNVNSFFCLDQSRRYNLECIMIHFFTKAEAQDLMFKIVTKFKFCDNNCPIDWIRSEENRKGRTSKGLFGVQKRQFDMESTFDYIEHVICRALDEIFTPDTWKSIIAEELKKADKQTETFYMMVAVFRRPICCILKDRWT